MIIKWQTNKVYMFIILQSQAKINLYIYNKLIMNLYTRDGMPER